MEVAITTLQFIAAHQHDDVQVLALQGHKYPEVDMPFALNQIAGRQMAVIKIPSWAEKDGILYPPHLSMEQCSSEQAARYKASLLQGETLVDMTGGLGVDFAFMASRFIKATYIEQQTRLAAIAEHNFYVLGLMDKVKVIPSDGIEYLQTMLPVDVLFLDPARRDNQGGRVVAIADCEPDVTLLEPLLIEKAKTVLIKLSPMLDVSLAMHTLKHISEVHVVAVNNECKELMLILRKDVSLSVKKIPIHCINLGKTKQAFSFTEQAETQMQIEYTNKIEEYLYEPNAAILKAGAYKTLTTSFPVKKLHANSHLYTSSCYVETFPGRKFQVMGVSGFGKKELKDFLRGMTQANITIRNFPISVADLRKRLKLREGGDIYLFATTLSNGQKMLIKTIVV